ncbi:MAG: CinA family nicotinamide mononucleotide deamidase-related protein [Candidatus Brocadiia bacterium]
MKAAILCTGSEIVRGRTTDTNSRMIVKILLSAGLPTEEIRSVNDNLDSISEAFQDLMARFDVVICSGGLGPTFDDLTRQALAQATGRPLAEDAAALQVIREGLARRNRLDLIEANRCQAQFPKGALPIPNRFGSAPGIYLENDGKRVFCLPGVPGELRGMLEGYVVPSLAPLAHTRIFTTGWHFCGIPEAELGQIVERVMADRGVEFAINAARGIITISLLAYEGATDRTTSAIEAAFFANAGKALVCSSGSTLERQTGDEIRKRRLTVGCIESCTGGLIAKRLTDTPGSSEYFRGGMVTYSNEIKMKLGVLQSTLAQYGAVSAEAAVEMAQRGKSWLGVDICVSATGIAGPDGGSEDKPVGTLFIAVCGPAGTTSRRFAFSGDREALREYYSTAAINLVRLAVLDLK